MTTNASAHEPENGVLHYFDLKVSMQRKILFSYFSVIGGWGIPYSKILKFGTLKIHMFEIMFKFIFNILQKKKKNDLAILNWEL